MCATWGILAGCALCTTLAKVVMIGPMDEIVSAIPAVQLTLFVDDVSAAAHGTCQEVAIAIKEVGDMLEQVVEPIGCQVAKPKTAVAASRAAVAKKVGRLLGIPTVSQAAVFLGADFAAGSKRRGWTTAGCSAAALKQ